MLIVGIFWWFFLGLLLETVGSADADIVRVPTAGAFGAVAVMRLVEQSWKRQRSEKEELAAASHSGETDPQD
jgi:hypothetical protein